MKKIIRIFFHTLGFELTKYTKPKKSIRSKNLKLYETINGNYYLPVDAYQDIVANTIKSNLIYDNEVLETAKKYIKKNTTVLDLGANFGQMSILFSNYVGTNGKVYSFEADDWIFEILNKNILANDKQNIIKPFYGAIHNINDETLIFPEQDFEAFGSYGSYGIDYNAKKGREVISITIDSLNITEPISFMKIDIQGGDLLAMKGAIKTIERNKMPIIFEYEYLFEEKYNLKFQEYVDFVKSINYRFEKTLSNYNFLIVPNN